MIWLDPPCTVMSWAQYNVIVFLHNAMAKKSTGTEQGEDVPSSRYQQLQYMLVWLPRWSRVCTLLSCCLQGCKKQDAKNVAAAMLVEHMITSPVATFENCLCEVRGSMSVSSSFPRGTETFVESHTVTHGWLADFFVHDPYR